MIDGRLAVRSHLFRSVPARNRQELAVVEWEEILPVVEAALQLAGQSQIRVYIGEVAPKTLGSVRQLGPTGEGTLHVGCPPPASTTCAIRA